MLQLDSLLSPLTTWRNISAIMRKCHEVACNLHSNNATDGRSTRTLPQKGCFRPIANSVKAIKHNDHCIVSNANAKALRVR